MNQSSIGNIPCSMSIRWSSVDSKRPANCICFFTLMLVVGLSCFAESAVAQVTSTWIGGTGFWTDAFRWDTADFPDNGNGGSNYIANVNFGTVTLQQDIAIDGLTFNGGSIGSQGGLWTLDLVSPGTQWTAGIFDSITVNATAGIAISGTAVSLRNNSVLNNAGNSTWSTGNIQTGSASTFNNQVGGVLTVTGDGTFQNNWGGLASSFNNAGTFTKSAGAGITNFITNSFNNTGTVNVDSGTLRLGGGGVGSGTWNINSSTLEFGGGTHELNTGTSVTGNGNVAVTGATVNFNAGTFNVGGNTRVDTGTFNVNSTATTNTLTQNGGAISGNNVLVANGRFDWNSGAIAGGTVQANGGLDIAAGTVSLQNGGVLNNAGNSTWSTGNIQTGSASMFNNLAGGELDVTGDNQFSNNWGGLSSSFINAGTFTKSNGMGTTSFINNRFENSGVVNAETGLIEFFSFTQTAGTLSLNGGDIGTNGFATIEIQGGQLVGNGTVFGSLNNSGGEIAPGFSAGSLYVEGDLALGAGSELSMEIGGLTQELEYDFLSVNGDISLNGLLSVSLINGFESQIQVGDTFTLVSSGNLMGGFLNVNNGDRLSAGTVEFEVFYGVGSPFGSTDIVVRATSISVPEPGHMVLVVVVGTTICLRRRRNVGSNH